MEMLVPKTVLYYSEGLIRGMATKDGCSVLVHIVTDVTNLARLSRLPAANSQDGHRHCKQCVDACKERDTGNLGTPQHFCIGSCMWKQPGLRGSRAL
jgi:hypothetical protein